MWYGRTKGRFQVEFGTVIKKSSEPVEYWYCTECRRIYEVQAVSCGEVLRVFKPDANYTDEYNIDNFEELFILWAKEMDDFLDFGRDYRFKDYIVQLTQSSLYPRIRK